MERAEFAFTKTVTQLENFLATMGKKPLHAQFGGSLQILILRGDRHYIAIWNIDRLAEGSIDFEKSLVVKK
jgi:hypothetical protein